MSEGDITTIEGAARAVEPVFRKHGWKYHDCGVPDWEDLEKTIRRLVFSDVFNDRDGESTSSGRFLVTRGDDLFSDDPNSRSIYLHIADL